MSRQKRDFSEEYLDGKFGSIHVIKKIIDWDEVWNNRDKYIEEMKGEWIKYEQR